MKKLSVLGTLTLLLLLSSCVNKPLDSSDVAFEGDWYSSYATMIIDLDGTGEYHYSDGSKTVDVEGLVKIKNDKLKIGVGILSKKFDIDSRPAIITDGLGNEYTSMVLDGGTWIKN